jgi:hypothetical protein
MRAFPFAVVLLAALAGPCLAQPTLGAPQETAPPPLLKFGQPQAMNDPASPATANPMAGKPTTTRTTYQSARSFVEATGPDADFFDPIQSWGPMFPAPPSDDAKAWSASSRSGLPTMWLRAEYLYWWTRGATLPPLATTAPSGVFPSLDQPGTTVLFGGKTGMLAQNGARFSLGFGLEEENATNPDSPRGIGMEMTYFFLSPRGRNFAAGSDGAPVLARPFTDIASGAPVPSAQLIANATIPDAPALAGAIVASTRTRLWGMEANMLYNVFRYHDAVESCNWYFIMGYRHLQLSDELTITEQVRQAAGVPGTTLVQDQFSTRSSFNGMQLGLRGERQVYGAWFVQVSGKLALGTVQERADIRGFTQDAFPGAGSVSGGLLAQPSNIGRASRDRFAVLPEGEIKAGYWLTRTLKAYVGYNALFLSEAARAGDQVDFTVNSNQVPIYTGGAVQPLIGDAARPAFHLQGTTFWAHGVTLGLEFNW